MITIPVIDISPFEAGGPGAGAVVDAVRAACEEHGFFVVAGHGIAPAVNEDLDRACRAFFSRPLQEKSGSSLFVNYYPATVTGPEPGQFRIQPPEVGAHTGLSSYWPSTSQL